MKKVHIQLSNILPINLHRKYIPRRRITRIKYEGQTFRELCMPKLSSFDPAPKSRRRIIAVIRPSEKLRNVIHYLKSFRRWGVGVVCQPSLRSLTFVGWFLELSRAFVFKWALIVAEFVVANSIFAQYTHAPLWFRLNRNSKISLSWRDLVNMARLCVLFEKI